MRRQRLRIAFYISVMVLLFGLTTACQGEEGETPVASDQPATVTLMTHDSFDASEEVLAQFEEAHNVRLEILPSGDAGTALNQAILARENPLADVFFGVDNTFLSRALEADIFEPYASPQLETIRDALDLDADNRLLPVDYGDVCLNYDKAYFSEHELAPPDSLEALLEPDYEDLLVVENPATSSPGLAFLLATIARFGTEGDYTYLDYWTELRENGVLVTNDWNDAYYGNFSVASDGNRPIVVSYASSPPAEVVFADPPVEEAPSGVVTADGACFRQIEFAGILRGTEHREVAEALIDFLLSVPFQEDIPLRMFVFPANEEATLPDVFVEHTQIPEVTASMDPQLIEDNREAWIEAWTEIVLR